MSSRTANVGNVELNKNEIEKDMKTNSVIVVDESIAETGIEFLENAKKKILDVQKSRCISNSKTPDILPRMFPGIFPYERGHRESPRTSKFSVEKGIQYYVRISTRRFPRRSFLEFIVFCSAKTKKNATVSEKSIAITIIFNI